LKKKQSIFVAESKKQIEGKTGN